MSISVDVNDLNNDAYFRGIEAGKEIERERIIKLLTNPLHHNIRLPDTHINCYSCTLIDLIKGENNAQRQTQETHPPTRFRDIANAE